MTMFRPFARYLVKRSSCSFTIHLMQYRRFIAYSSIDRMPKLMYDITLKIGETKRHMDAYQVEIDQHKNKIVELRLKTNDLELEIDDLEQETQNALNNKTLSESQAYWIHKVQTLMKKHHPLLIEEQLLRDEMEILRIKELSLRSEHLTLEIKKQSLIAIQNKCKWGSIDCSEDVSILHPKLMELINALMPNTQDIDQRFIRPYLKPKPMLTMDTVGRMEAFNNLLWTWDANLNRLTDQGRRKIPVVVAQLGLGASHILSVFAGRGRWHFDGCQWIKHKDTLFNDTLNIRQSNTHNAIRNAIGVAITLDDMEYIDKDIETYGLKAVVAIRLLHSHFHRGDWDFFFKALVLNVKDLDIDDAVALILADVDIKYPGEDRYLIVAVDGLIQLAGGKLYGEDAVRAYISAVDHFAKLRENERVFLIASSLREIYDHNAQKSRILHYPLKLLTEDEVIQLCNQQSEQVYKKLSTPVYQRLVIESAGLPRYIEAVISIATQTVASQSSSDGVSA